MDRLLTTKLHVPRRRRGLVIRAGLSERLGRGDEAALTLVSAPAGFGKTTVLTEWLASLPPERPVAWLSLDARDDDPAVFWSYVVAALQTAAPQVGVDAAALLREGRTSIDQVLTALVNDLDAVAGDVVLVLDDYHVVGSPEVHDGMTFLLEHLPARVQLVISTRADPALPLARLRARGELVEVRADDLRFAADEASAYLTGTMGLALTDDDVAALQDRTEGWIAALQLAALSMHGRDDLAGFVAGFAGDDRYVVDYLVEEVLQRQPADVRDFLLQTSVLGRLSGPLCDVVVGREDAQAMLLALERANLFLVPLDDRRHWYRYHHLFADVLHARLLDEQPEHVAELHRRASGWHAANGEPSEAIAHALAGGDAERAADLVELAMPAAQANRQESTLRSWLEALPDEVMRRRPALSTTYAGTLVQHGDFAGVAERLRDAERCLDATGTPDRALDHASDHASDHALDQAQARRVRSQIALYRAALAQVTGDLAAAETHAREALEMAGEEDHLLRGAASGVLGLAHWGRGDLGDAYRWWSDSHAQLHAAGHRSDTLGVSLALADISIAQGRLRNAWAVCERGLAEARSGVPVLRGAADMHVALSELFRERDDLEAARQHLAASADLGEHAGLPQNRHRSSVALARVRQAEGNLDAAVDLFDQAEQVYVADMFPDVRPIAALRARVWLAQGHVEKALDWVRLRGLAADDDLSYGREYEHITLARVLLAQHATSGDPACLSRAAGLLDRLLQAAERGGRTGSAIDVLLVRALAQRAGGDADGALGSLARALSLAEPEGYVRAFLDEGPPIVPLLRALASQGVERAYARRLLAAAPAAGNGTSVQQPGSIDPLSARELDVLRLLATDLDGPDIARHLFLSVNTVRTHTKNIFAKLGVNSRRAAVRRGEELDLLARAADDTGRALSDR